MIKPNFLIIGAPKSGTTSLYNYLSQHPEISFSKNKEPKYFSFKDNPLDYVGNKRVVNQIKNSTVRTLDTYQDLFKNINTKFVGEASPNYLHTPEAAKNISEYNPNMKLIVILRNPVDKTFSDWKHNYAMGYEPVDNFKKALSLIEERKKMNCVPYFDYLEKGNFATHIERYYKYFKKEQLKIIFFDDFKKNPNASCNQIIKFLGIEESFKFNTKIVYMKARPLYKSYRLKRISNFLGAKVSNQIEKTIDDFNQIDLELNNQDKVFLKEYFQNDIKKLETITSRDLSSWLQ